MKFGVSWGVKGIRPDAREAAKEAAHQRLDEFTRRIERMTHSRPTAYAPRRDRSNPDQFDGGPRKATPPLAPAMAQPNAKLPPGLDRAVAEISARRRALNGEPVPARPQAQAPAPIVDSSPNVATAMTAPTPPPLHVPLPAQDLPGLENQLRHITDQIETLRKPEIERAINALHDELGEIGRTLNAAMPRQVLESIEKQILALGTRINEGRQAGVDQHALAGIEHGLAEVRSALRELTPAEKLAGFNEAVTRLASKIDEIVAQNDPAVFQQLASTVTTLREMVGHIASSGTVNQLATEVRGLGAKIDQLTNANSGSDALTNLLIQREQNGDSVSPRLESLMHSLTDKIDQIRSSRDDNNIAINHLEDRIANLVTKLDAKANKPLDDLHADAAPAVDEFKHNMTRIEDALESVHVTLGLVVERLALIEKEFRSEGRAQSPAEDALALPVDNAAVRAASASPEPLLMTPDTRTHTPLQAPIPSQQENNEPPPPPRRRVATSLPINPEPSADQPLAPGSGPPQFSSRIAASEAALDGTGPIAATTPSSKSNFIAAARRAAQAATQQLPTAPAPRGEPVLEPKNSRHPSVRGKIMKRVKTLFIAASIIAVVVGGFQITGNVLRFGGAPENEPPKNSQAQTGKVGTDTVEANKVEIVKTDTAVRDATPKAASSRTINPLPLSTVAPPAVPTGTATMLLTPPPGASATTQHAPPLLSPPAVSAPAATAGKSPAAKGDVTGSIPEAATNPPAGRANEPATLDQEQLPLAIGGPRLRSAALSGDAAAAYEVALRLAEGRGVPVDLKQAAHWFARAASAGLAPAQFRYASMLEKGQGVEKDKALARQFYLKAAAKGHAKAMHNLAVLYAQGVNGKPDYAAAVKWFRQAAERGVADSQYNLGVLTARGFGTEKNFAESYKWFALAAAQGDQESAKKRDEIGTHLDATALAAAREAVKAFKVKPQPRTATTVPKPQGGWDNAAGAPHSPKAKTQPQTHQPSHAPLSLDSFTAEKR